MPVEEVHAQKGACKEAEIQQKHPIKLRPYVLMIDVSGVAKWYGHDMFKSENQAARSEKAVTSKRQPVKYKVIKYVNIECIKWSKDCPKNYERGNSFLPNRAIQYLPLGMRRFHD